MIFAKKCLILIYLVREWILRDSVVLILDCEGELFKLEDR